MRVHTQLFLLTTVLWQSINIIKLLNKERITMSQQNTIKMPTRIVQRFIEIEHELEDWLLSQDKKFINKMNKARKDDLQSKFIPWNKAKKKICLD